MTPTYRLLGVLIVLAAFSEGNASSLPTVRFRDLFSPLLFVPYLMAHTIFLNAISGGDPTDSEEPFQCENCDMCCNSFDACQLPLEASYSSLNGLASAAVLIAGTLVFLLVFGALAWLLSQKFAFFHPSLTTNGRCLSS